MKYYLAIDLGATSGRHLISYLDENKEIVLKEVHRFKTGVDDSKDGFVWNLPRIFNEILEGIKKAFSLYPSIESLSIDTWGVDYVLLDEEDKPLMPFYSYRNQRTSKDLTNKVHSIIPFSELYERTGIQFAPFNTIYQLFSDKEIGKLSKASSMLMLPEYFSFLLTGKKVREYSMASTTGLINLQTKSFDGEILKKLDLPSFVNEKLCEPGYVLGSLTDEVAQHVGGNCKVIMCASHDTGSAFEAIDSKPNSVIISSGTWSLLGIKSNKPISTQEAFKANFTNEGGVGYIRFLKNIMGMWIPNSIASELGENLPELCKRLKDPDNDYIFDVNDSSLLNPTNMEEAVKKLLPRQPKSTEELFQSVYLSLAVCYKKTIAELEGITNEKYKTIYIIGGGANNAYLNKLVEKVTGLEVIALPMEATSIGNIKIQIKSSKEEL